MDSLPPPPRRIESVDSLKMCDPTSSPPRPPSRGKYRRCSIYECSECEKKMLFGFRCRCGRTFCIDHRLPEVHYCFYDYKAAGRDAIAKANPVVKADKIQRF